MSWHVARGLARRRLVLVAAALVLAGASRLAGQGAAQRAPRLGAEQTLAGTVSEARMAETVRRLVGFGPRMYGTPSNHAAAAWLAASFREAGLEVVVREDTPRAWYQPMSWDVRAGGDAAGSPLTVLRTAWPYTGSPSAKGEGLVSLQAGPGAVCLLSATPTPENAAGCEAVLVDGRASASGWPAIGRLRGAWKIPVFAVSPTESAPLRGRVSAGEKVRVAFALEAQSGTGPARTVVATLPGRDRTKHILFCAHGDSDSGGPGANDNASGVAIVVEIARAVAAAVRDGRIPTPAWDLRFASWGGEISSTREYAAEMEKAPSRLQAVFNFDQSGFGSWKDALYVEPDDVPANRALITLVRAVMTDHLGTKGFPARAATVRTLGGTDSYVFQPKAAGAAVYPAVSLYASAWDEASTYPITEGFPPLNWYADERPGMVTVDGDAFYHLAGDTPENTTDTEPFNMGWCARIGLLSALRLMSGT